MKKSFLILNFNYIFLLQVCCIFFVAGFSPAHAQTEKEIKLVLQITVDGLRGDLINRYAKQMGPDGFKYLLSRSTVYTNAHYLHANTETIVGHTTLATGAYPSGHGMIGNAWFDRKSNDLVYNTEDEDYPLIGEDASSTDSGHVDPAQKQAGTNGRSPRAILAPTLSDTLAAFYGGRAKIFSVSGKDRGAIPMAGRSGKAFWLSTDTGTFVTSSYYYDTYPDWAAQWNGKEPAKGFADKSWNLLNDISTYLNRDLDDRPYETDLKGFGRVFPHKFSEKPSPLLYTQVIVSPEGDRFTADFAKTILTNESLGQDDIPDYLAVSFSSVDAVNHFFGPSSLENEDTVLQLDKTLAELLSFINNKVGLDHTLVVLASDHGMADMPEYMAGMGFSSRRLYSENILDATNTIGQELFKIDNVARSFFRPYLYLDLEKLGKAGIDVKKAEQEIARKLAQKEGIAIAAPQTGAQGTQTTPLLKKIQNNYNPARSGNIYVAQEPYWFLFEKGPVAGMHGSPWLYDTHVPILFMGPGIGAKKIHKRVHPSDVAPTISALLGMAAPAAARGTILKGVFKKD